MPEHATMTLKPATLRCCLEADLWCVQEMRQNLQNDAE